MTAKPRPFPVTIMKQTNKTSDFVPHHLHTGYTTARGTHYKSILTIFGQTPLLPDQSQQRPSGSKDYLASSFLWCECSPNPNPVNCLVSEMIAN